VLCVLVCVRACVMLWNVDCATDSVACMHARRVDDGGPQPPSSDHTHDVPKSSSVTVRCARSVGAAVCRRCRAPRGATTSTSTSTTLGELVRAVCVAAADSRQDTPQVSVHFSRVAGAW
jgi:hypothetical protein